MILLMLEIFLICFKFGPKDDEETIHSRLELTREPWTFRGKTWNSSQIIIVNEFYDFCLVLCSCFRAYRCHYKTL